MKEEKKIFEKSMKISKITHTRTEKNNEETEETKITLEGGDIAVTLKKPGNALKEFIDGEDVQVVIIQPQATLDVEVIGEL